MWVIPERRSASRRVTGKSSVGSRSEAAAPSQRPRGASVGDRHLLTRALDRDAATHHRRPNAGRPYDPPPPRTRIGERDPNNRTPPTPAANGGAA